MLKLFIQNLKNGTHHISISDEVVNLNWEDSEFFGEVKVEGKILKVDNRLTLNAKAICNAKLICDWSLEEFDFLDQAEFELEIIESLVLGKESDTEIDENKVVIQKEDKELDITQRVYEELVLALPMKRVSPKFDGMSFEEVFDKYSVIPNKEEKENNTNQLWSVLKNINLN